MFCGLRRRGAKEILVVLFSLNACLQFARAAEPRTKLFVATDQAARSESDRPGKLLLRELARQALLIAARDQLGLATRDQSLREAGPAADDPTTLSLKVRTTEVYGESLTVKVSLSAKSEPEPVFERTLSQRPLIVGLTDYVHYVALLEELSRKEFVDVLVNSGARGEALVWTAVGKASPQVEALLAEMNFLSQFSALRQLHAQQRAEGQSPESLAALVRAYSNLGVLTSFHWNASHKVFKARALLYSQRLVELDQKSAWAYKHRAYARALSGLHAFALDDLTAARAVLPEKAEQRPPCPWEPLIDAYCKYDRDALETAAVGEQRQLATMLAFLTVENSNSEYLTLTAGAKALEAVPECYLINDAMGRHKGVRNRHHTTLAGPLVLHQTLSGRMASIPGLPEAVRGKLIEAALDESHDIVLDAAPQRMELIQALLEERAAGTDLAEPSWQVLGRQLEDVTFVHLFHRLEFLKYNLGVPEVELAPQMRKARELVAGHPYSAVIECLGLEPQGNQAQIREKCLQLPEEDIGLFLYPFYSRVRKVPVDLNEDLGGYLWNRMAGHTDQIAQDLEQLGARVTGPQPAAVFQLRVCSPHSPQGIALFLTKVAGTQPGDLRRWEKEFSAHAVVLKALSARYAELGLFTEAERCSRLYLKEIPDQKEYKFLAELYKSQGDLVKWKEILEESLTGEDFSLAHARTRVTLAYYHIEQGEVEQALPYALAAAETGASWALACAADCYERLEQWPKAEEFVRANAQRYDDQAFSWYLWCRRTGRGDSKAAMAVAERQARLLKRSTAPERRQILGIYYLILSQPQRARQEWQPVMGTGNPYGCLHYALLSQELSDVRGRNRAILDAVTRGPRFKLPTGEVDTSSVAFARWLNNACHLPEGAEPPVDALQEVLKSLGPENVANVAYFAGRYFHLIGNAKLARAYYQRCLDTRAHSKWNFVLATVHLHDLDNPAPAGEAEPGEKLETEPAAPTEPTDPDRKVVPDPAPPADEEP